MGRFARYHPVTVTSKLQNYVYGKNPFEMLAQLQECDYGAR
jgi:hypothetical protein